MNHRKNRWILLVASLGAAGTLATSMAFATIGYKDGRVEKLTAYSTSHPTLSGYTLVDLEDGYLDGSSSCNSHDEFAIDTSDNPGRAQVALLTGAKLAGSDVRLEIDSTVRVANYCVVRYVRLL